VAVRWGSASRRAASRFAVRCVHGDRRLREDAGGEDAAVLLVDEDADERLALTLESLAAGVDDLLAQRFEEARVDPYAGIGPVVQKGHAAKVAGRCREELTVGRAVGTAPPARRGSGRLPVRSTERACAAAGGRRRFEVGERFMDEVQFERVPRERDRRSDERPGVLNDADLSPAFACDGGRQLL